MVAIRAIRHVKCWDNRQCSTVSTAVEYCIDSDNNTLPISLQFGDICRPIKSMDAMVLPTNAFRTGSANTNYWLFKNRKNVETAVYQYINNKALLHEAWQQEERPLQIGSIAACPVNNTSSTPFRYQQVIQVVAPRVVDREHSLLDLRYCYQNILKYCASDVNIRTIAFPAIGCGINAWPAKESAQQFVLAYDKFNNEEGRDLNMEICFYFIEKRAYHSFQKVFNMWRDGK